MQKTSVILNPAPSQPAESPHPPLPFSKLCPGLGIPSPSLFICMPRVLVISHPSGQPSPHAFLSSCPPFLCDLNVPCSPRYSPSAPSHTHPFVHSLSAKLGKLFHKNLIYPGFLNETELRFPTSTRAQNLTFIRSSPIWGFPNYASSAELFKDFQ